MNLRTAAAAWLLVALPSLVGAQTIVEPWHVSDNGGGTSSGGGIVLRSSAGQPAVALMISSGTDLESGYIPGLLDFSGSNVTLSATVSDGWNLLSLPVVPADSSKTTLFPGSTSSAFSYIAGYVVANYLRIGVGYWLKFGSSSTVPLSGTSVQQESLAVAAGWNIIGPPSTSIAASDITPVGTTVASRYFSYSSGSGYLISDTLQPGEGYWVKVSAAGKLVLGAGPGRVSPRSAPQSTAKSMPALNPSSDSPLPEGIASLTISDAAGKKRTLFFTTTRTDLDPAVYELPPAPPGGIFDARFSTNRFFESAAAGTEKTVSVAISSALYPITIDWKVNAGSSGAVLLLDGKPVDMRASRSIQIGRPASAIRLRLREAGAVDLPKAYALLQNYPNPFNPATVIRYDLPEDAHVALRIYNALGQLVRTLRDDLEAAGYKSAQWGSENDAGRTVASGLYFYRLEAIGAGSHHAAFTEVKKMLLIR